MSDSSMRSVLNEMRDFKIEVRAKGGAVSEGWMYNYISGSSVVTLAQTRDCGTPGGKPFPYPPGSTTIKCNAIVSIRRLD